MDRSSAFRLQSTLFYIGFASILSQILLVREFLISFYGNELSIGIIFAGWLVWIGIGSALGNKIVKRRKYFSRLFYVALAVTPLVIFMQILAVKFVRAFIHTPPGEFLSILELLVYSFIILSVGCFLWGMLFTLGAKSLTQETKKLWLGVNKAYVLELLGSVTGGLLFSFLLGSLISTLQIVFLLTLIACSMVSSLIYPKKIKWITLSFIGMIIIYIFLFEPIRSLEHNINTYQWLFINDKLTFVRSIDTKYQNLSLLRLENQYTVYADGRPAYNIPNTYDAEVFTHSIMVHQPNAKRVLILSGGFNGVLKEILKYPVNEIEYIEIDPALLPFIESVLDQQNRNALNNVKVKIVSGDGREFLSRKQHSFDVIILNIGEPSTASLNRFFTLEFYRQCASRLSYNGICAVSFPSSTEYIANELKDLDASIYHTFKRAFTNVLIVPGNRAIIIGSKGNQSLIFQPDSLARRYKNSGISSEYFSEYMYEDLLLPERVKFITETLESIQNYRLNTDNNPVTYYFDLMLWNRFLHGDNQFFSSVTRSRIFITGGVIAGLLLLLLICCRRQGIKRKKIVLAIIIACSGLVGMALNLLLLLNFQETFGSVYEMVGAMIAANMLGMALGALAAAWLVKYCQWKPVLLVVLLVFTAAVLFIPIVLNILLLIHILPLTLSITMLSGGLVGMLFGIVNRFYLDNSANVGSIYAFDVTGSSIGALTTCSLLLPVLGIHETTYLLAMIVFLAIVATITTNRIA